MLINEEKVNSFIHTTYNVIYKENDSQLCYLFKKYTCCNVIHENFRMFQKFPLEYKLFRITKTKTLIGYIC